MQNPEELLVPFHSSTLPAGPWLVFAPHADDETFGMGGSLLHASAAGIATHVVVMTDGALGGNRPDLVAVRQQEVREATRMLGVESLQCWSEPDRGLQVCDRLVGRICEHMETLEPASVFFPGMLEPHPDHRTTALLVWQALQQVRTRHHPPQPYAYEITAQNPINRLIDVTGQRAAKEAVMGIYNSQNTENDYPALVQALDIARSFTLPAEISCAEGFYCFEPDDLDYSLPEVTRRIIERYFE